MVWNWRAPILLAAVAVMMAGCGEQSREATSRAADATSEAAKAIAADAKRQLGVAGELLDDTVLTGRVRAALLAQPELRGLDIKVRTLDNVVTLTGSVESDAVRRQIETVARGVSGVRDVKNALAVQALAVQTPAVN